MTKLSAALSGVKIYYKNKKTEALLLNCGPNVLKVMLTTIKECCDKTPTNPLNITELLSELRMNNVNAMRGPLSIDLEMLKRIGVLTVESTWRETTIKPNYTKVEVTVDDDGRTVVKLE